ncbi:hypothetical protein [Candidatus Nanohalobium constans]|uniref:Uncharacterized protein n=1 Tax=Candidatus Nanohalobium constans TaxID=2565781 RepID=A0A5Q0UFE3_9ARCH|nr:hypothetical protein [Candidatus Nanohalobium constans]QGA80332.1 hypothetical protein LC1Nh_0431 [Candidatus Nanohalobium constans]
MNIGETKTDTITVAGDSNDTITVPSGETWKFTHINANNNSNILSNANLCIGYTLSNGDHYIIKNQRDDHTPAIGGEVAPIDDASISSIIIDGDVHEGVSIWADSNDLKVYWAATRIS